MSGCRGFARALAWTGVGALLFVPEGRPADRPGIVLNEIMACPPSGGSEWVELWNLSDERISLEGWTLSDSRRKPSLLTSEPDEMEPGGHRVWVADLASFFQHFPHADPEQVRELDGTWPVLNNSQSSNGPYADMVILMDASRAVVDSLAYGEDWGVDGCSLERLSPYVGPVAANWCASLAPECGTPGKPNSVYLESVPGSTLEAEPDPFRPEIHGVTFVSFRISLSNPSIRLQVFDTAGRLVRTLLDDRPAGRNGRLAWDGTDDAGESVPTGMYLLYLQALDVAAGACIEAKGTVVVARGF